MLDLLRNTLEPARSKGTLREPRDQFAKEALEWQNIQGEIQRNYEMLQRSLSQEFHRKMQLWERQRQERGDPGSPSHLSGVNEAALPADFRRKYEAWQRRRGHQQAESQPSTGSSAGPYHDEYLFPQSFSHQDHDNLPPEFRRKLEAWERMKDKGSGNILENEAA